MNVKIVLKIAKLVITVQLAKYAKMVITLWINNVFLVIVLINVLAKMINLYKIVFQIVHLIFFLEYYLKKNKFKHCFLY